MIFYPSAAEPVKTSERCFWFIFNENNELVINANCENEEKIINRSVQDEHDISIIRQQYLGRVDDVDCYSAEIDETHELSCDFEFCAFRSLYGLLNETLYTLLGHASQIVTWDKNHQFCSKCGSKASSHKTLRAKKCNKCESMNFPRISPSMIVAVIRDGQILLGRSHHFRPGLYSVLAGFSEPGENLEECVKREIFEEVGIKVKNIRYHSSQPWAFPHSLMVGFIADYESGEITIDPVEIEDAGWYTVETFPDELPSPSTIATDLINYYRESVKV